MSHKLFIKIGLKSAIIATILTQSSLSYGLNFVSDRSTLGANDQLDWSSLAVPPFSPLSSTFTTISDKGLEMTVSFPPPNTELGIGQPLYFQTTSDGIRTNYSPNDFILFSGFNLVTQLGNPGPLTLTFETPILGVGSQLTVDDTFSFLGTIEAFDINNVSLGEFSFAGTSSEALDNSAQFYGVINDVPTISKVTFSTDINNKAIGLNFLSLVTVSVPEPSLSMGLIFIIGCGLISKHKKE
ncbi:MAG: hypothetical protein QNJ42_12200 [Crocosphaera sp.]|nr:hypothetical protein [Crocosphaera sp.]